MEIPIVPLRWSPAFRIIPSRFPPIPLFEDVADPADLEAVFLVESLTNDRLRDQAGELALVPPAERVSGSGSSFVMGAFTHISPHGGRFNDASFGAFYVSHERETAIAETVYHRERFLREMAAPPTQVDMRVLRCTIRCELHDLRGMREAMPEIYRSDDYSASQALARELRAGGAFGVVWESVRQEVGECAALFRPRAITRCRQAEHLGYLWDGERVGVVYEKRVIRG
ncbi:MAG: RES family NAD+ phosphorylase [Gemmatimonadetes bacterium]|nr:RES family NAD+ phosphorylase [Gemmatimonadota bacterium]